MTSQFLLFISSFLLFGACSGHSWDPGSKGSKPEFMEEMSNVTVFLGRTANIACTVKDLRTHRVAWLRSDEDLATLISVQTTVLSNDPRVRVLSSNNNQKWTLQIKEVTESDAGAYMCQVNSEPMISQTAFLDVLVPPTIIEEETSSDIAVDERNPLSLKCRGRGYPSPAVTWRREDGRELHLETFAGKEMPVLKSEGEYLNISQVSRKDSGAYLCILTNTVPPSVSKRINVQVNFRPKIRVQTLLIGASKGSEAVLECQVEGSPRPTTSWMRSDEHNTLTGPKYQMMEEVSGSNTIIMRLKISDVNEKDFGAYKCSGKNNLGDKEGYIRLFETKVINNREAITGLRKGTSAIKNSDEISGSSSSSSSSNQDLATILQNYKSNRTSRIRTYNNHADKNNNHADKNNHRFLNSSTATTLLCFTPFSTFFNLFLLSLHLLLERSTFSPSFSSSNPLLVGSTLH